MFKCSLCLHIAGAIHLHDKGGEVTMFLESEIHILLLLLLLFRLEIFIWWLVPMREVFSVHDTNVVNNFSPYLPEVTELNEAMGKSRL